MLQGGLQGEQLSAMVRVLPPFGQVHVHLQLLALHHGLLAGVFSADAACQLHAPRLPLSPLPGSALLSGSGTGLGCSWTLTVRQAEPKATSLGEQYDVPSEGLTAH